MSNIKPWLTGLQLASSADNTLQEVSDMLEELSMTLPRLKFYEKTVEMDSEMESSLLAVYQEVICFYARAIHFFRSHKHCTCFIVMSALQVEVICAEANLQERSYYATHGLIFAEISKELPSELSVCLLPSKARSS